MKFSEGEEKDFVLADFPSIFAIFAVGSFANDSEQLCQYIWQTDDDWTADYMVQYDPDGTICREKGFNSFNSFNALCEATCVVPNSSTTTTSSTTSSSTTTSSRGID